LVWDGNVNRLEGIVLVTAYVVFVATIWLLERRPPRLGEAGELDEEIDPTGRVGRDLGHVLIGIVALTVGSIALVEGVRRLTDVEATQTRLGLTIVGFATAFELVVLAFSASRHGITEAVVAGVIGSYAYNMTMSLGAGAIVAPLGITDATLLHLPMVLTLGLLAGAILLAIRRDTLGRAESLVLFAGYPLFLIAASV
jgi:cation:H+ antiporter